MSSSRLIFRRVRKVFRRRWPHTGRRSSVLTKWLRDFCVFRSALLCSVVPNATGAARILLIKSKLNFQWLRYEPGGREFESLRARQ